MENQNTYSVVIKDLKIGYKERNNVRILSNLINAKARPAELIALVGPNGAGKSTLLRSLCHLQPVLCGDILLQGYNTKHLSRNHIARQLSLVTTELQRTSKLSVFDLVALGRFPYGNWYSKINDSDKSVINEALEQVGMIKFLQRYITELSDGELQRVMIARALAQDTPIIILDEPTAFLDLANKFSVVQLLWKLCRYKQKTIIYSTHDINVAMQYADVFWVLNQAELSTGAPEDLLLNKTIEKLFLGNDLVFDINSSQFIKNKKYGYNIHIQGNGTDYQVTRMALDRLGFSVDCNKPAKLIVTITRKADSISWEIAYNDTIQKVDSIYRLQSVLKQLK